VSASGDDLENLHPAMNFPLIHGSGFCRDGFLPGKQELNGLRSQIQPIHRVKRELDSWMESLGDAEIVMLGGATCGSREYHQYRSWITKRLIGEKGFKAVVLVGGLLESSRVDRFVRGQPGDFDSASALSGFKRFPSWVWFNREMMEFVSWLRFHNSKSESVAGQVGFYGLDSYCLHKSMNEIVRFLDETDPEIAAKARAQFSCVDRFGRDPQNYGLLAGADISDGCRANLIQFLASQRRNEAEKLMRTNGIQERGYFEARCAQLASNALDYYRNLFRSYTSSWNLRARHLMESLAGLVAHLRALHGKAKVVVWGHNSDVGDASATELAWRGDLNLGQLVRETFPGQCKLVGMTTYQGSVTVAPGWQTPWRRQPLVPADAGCVECWFHQIGVPGFLLDFNRSHGAARMLRRALPQRAIGAVGDPARDCISHCYEACLADQFDAILHIDRTRALGPPVTIAAHPRKIQTHSLAAMAKG
jgi:erythromycin esterase-like protein